MFYLYGMCQDNNAISETPTNHISNTIKISNGIFDQLNILNYIDIATNIFNLVKPETFTNTTILNAMFRGNLDGGEIGTLMTDLNHLELQRKEYNNNDWVTLYTIYKDTNGDIVSNFTTYDTYTQNNTLYDYRLVPVDTNGNYGYALQKSVLSQFSNAFICDGQNVYKITLELKYGNTQQNQKSAVYTPLNSKYPFIAYNALTNYESGNVSAVLLEKTSLQGNIDRKAQVQLVNEFNNWLVNGKAKILKDYNGRIKVISIIDVVSNDYYSTLGNGICRTTFTYNEIGDLSQESLDNNNLTNQFIFNIK